MSTHNKFHGEARKTLKLTSPSYLELCWAKLVFGLAERLLVCNNILFTSTGKDLNTASI